MDVYETNAAITNAISQSTAGDGKAGNLRELIPGSNARPEEYLDANITTGTRYPKPVSILPAWPVLAGSRPHLREDDLLCLSKQLHSPDIESPAYPSTP